MYGRYLEKAFGRILVAKAFASVIGDFKLISCIGFKLISCIPDLLYHIMSFTVCVVPYADYLS